MREKTFHAPGGNIHYWTSDICPSRPTLAFLPGLTADHRLFERQFPAFQGDFNLFTWDAPGHGASRPFPLDFTLDDKAAWLRQIFAREKISRPILAGQSMGGYLSQCFMKLFPGEAAGFVSIDSASLKRRYITAAELLLLRHMEGVYRAYPWKTLVRAGSEGVAVTAYGREQMREMMLSYDRDEYCRLVGHGYRILARAIAENRPYRIDCPALLLCGDRDRAGFTRRYNRRWAEKERLEIVWIPGAGHNANADAPQRVNDEIQRFAQRCASPSIRP